MQPSSSYEREFQIRSVFDLFDLSRSWCLQAVAQGSKGDASDKLQVRPCKSYSADEINLQKWKRDVYGQLLLADPLENPGYCIKSTARTLYLDNCQANEVGAKDFNTQFILDNDDDAGTIAQVKSSISYYVGFDPSRRFSRLRLYKKGTINNSLNKWQVVYGNFGP